MGFPVDHRSERSFEASWSGEVVVCDIDRTYLYTRFSSLKGLLQIPLEFAVDKQAIEGMVVLLREVRRGPGRESRHTPLYFVSASPAQLRSVIQRKMLLDGLEFDGTIFKDWLGVLGGLRLGRLREQLGFKVTALLRLRQDLPRDVSQVLIGDDLESDALAFALYADALAGRVDDEELLRILLHHGVAYDDARAIQDLRGRLPRQESVRRGYIRLERHGEPEAFLAYWPHVAACHGALQIALGLWQEGSISGEGVERVAHDLRLRGREGGELDACLRDACRRGLVGRERAAGLRESLSQQGLVRVEGELPEVDPTWARQAAGRAPAAPWTPRIGGR